MRTRRIRVPEKLRELGERIEEWRGTPERSHAMPEELWEAATQAGRELGVYRVMRTLGLNYRSLSRRVRPEESRGGEITSAMGGFVELSGAIPSPSEGKTNVEVELSDRVGRTLRVRMEQCGPVDLAGLAERLWRCRT